MRGIIEKVVLVAVLGLVFCPEKVWEAGGELLYRARIMAIEAFTDAAEDVHERTSEKDTDRDDLVIPVDADGAVAP